MKRTMCFFAALVLFTGCAILNGQEQRLISPGSEPVVFNPPQPERVELENGMVLYLLEDHELPLITSTASIRTGSIYEPAELAGLAGMTGALMRTGGTAKLNADEINRRLEQMSAAVNVGIGPEQATASLSALKEDFEQAFDIFAMILQEPVFEKEKIEINRNHTLQGLRQIPDNPQSFAFREFKKLLYAGDPRGIQPNIATIKKIRRSDMVCFHRTYFRPEAIMIAVSGDFERKDMISRIRRHFDSWKPAAGAVAQSSPPATLKKTQLYHVQKKLPQSTIILGQFAPPKNHPDYFAFQVIDFIIGSGGFTSRLFSQIRSTHGLAYSVGSFYRGDIDYGVFGAYCMTKSDSTNRALSLMIDIVEKIKQGEISEQELAWAKESILNNFIFSFTSSAQIAGQQMQLEYDRLPPDFLRTAPDKIRRLKLEDIRRVAATWLTAEKMVILTVGDAAQLDARLESLGEVQTITSDVLDEK